MIKSDKQYPRYILYEFERKVKRGKASAYACPESIRPLRYVVQNATYLDAKKPFFGKMAGLPTPFTKGTVSFVHSIYYEATQYPMDLEEDSTLRPITASDCPDPAGFLPGILPYLRIPA